MGKVATLEKCPICESAWVSKKNAYGLQNSPYGSPCTIHCTNCRWNNASENRLVTKEQYQYYCRLQRLSAAPHQIWPPQRKQAYDMIKEAMGELYPRQVPYWMRDHLEKATAHYTRVRSWYFTKFCQSRWEYHSMLEAGTITTPQEYQAYVLARRAFEAEQEPSEYEDESHYWEYQ